MSLETHVPAWKRIGLKLKRKIENEHGESSTNHNLLRSTKKQKLKKTQPVPAKSSTDQIDSSRDDATEENDNELKDSSTSNRAKLNTTRTPDNVRERKSVTFSTSSKLEDGPSEAPEEQQSPEILDSHDSSVAKLQKLEKTKQRVKSAANAKNPVQPEHSKSERYLQYLDEYYDQRQQWKFNKNLQIKLLQNVFDVSRIPNSYDAKLSSYLSGLKGGARKRLLEEAKTKREASRETSAAASSIDHADEEMGQDQPHGDNELQSQAAGSQQRAELIFTALSNSPNADAISLQQDAAASANKDRGQQPRTKKRSRGKKRRTGFDTRKFLASDDDESSTSDSDSNSSLN